MRGVDLQTYKQTLVKEGFQPNNTWPEIRRRMYPLEDCSLKEANEKLVSFAFVRDPFDRLVSCYYNKMFLKDWFTTEQDLKWIRDEILTK